MGNGPDRLMNVPHPVELSISSPLASQSSRVPSRGQETLTLREESQNHRLLAPPGRDISSCRIFEYQPCFSQSKPANLGSDSGFSHPLVLSNHSEMGSLFDMPLCPTLLGVKTQGWPISCWHNPFWLCPPLPESSAGLCLLSCPHELLSFHTRAASLENLERFPREPMSFFCRNPQDLPSICRELPRLFHGSSVTLGSTHFCQHSVLWRWLLLDK